MSAPQTNVERQKRRHFIPLIGIALVTVFAVILIVYWLFEEVSQADPQSPEDTTEVPATEIPPEVITPGPSTDPATQPAPLAPQPAPQSAPQSAPQNNGTPG